VIGSALTDTAAQILVRIRGDRVFYTDPNLRSAGTTGRPRRPRHPVRPVRPSQRARTHSRTVRPGQTPWQRARQQLDRPTPQTRMPRPLGRQRRPTHRGRHRDPRRRRAPTQAQPLLTEDAVAVVVRTGRPDLNLCWRAYLRRFDIEHTLRFVRSTLGWTTPARQTPTKPTAGPGCS
jgi:hypothetical protein